MLLYTLKSAKVLLILLPELDWWTQKWKSFLHWLNVNYMKFTATGIFMWDTFLKIPKCVLNIFLKIENNWTNETWGTLNLEQCTSWAWLSCISFGSDFLKSLKYTWKQPTFKHASSVHYVLRILDYLFHCSSNGLGSRHSAHGSSNTEGSTDSSIFQLAWRGGGHPGWWRLLSTSLHQVKSPTPQKKWLFSIHCFLHS